MTKYTITTTKQSWITNDTSMPFQMEVAYVNRDLPNNIPTNILSNQRVTEGICRRIVENFLLRAPKMLRKPLDRRA